MAAREILLICGIVAALVYVGSDIVAAVSWAGYSFTDQSVSELRAIGAPTRSFLVPVLLIYAALEIAFGFGVWKAAGQNRVLRISGMLLVALGILDLTAIFWPMHIRGAEATLTDTLHIIGTVLTVILILLVIGFGSTAGGKRLRVYSYVTLAVLIVTGAWAAPDGARIAENLPTPWLGVKERINIYGYMLWLIVLAVVLLRKESDFSARPERQTKI